MSSVCIECGFQADRRSDLEEHWRRDKHGPDYVAGAAIDRARVSVGAETEGGAEAEVEKIRRSRDDDDD